MMAKFVFVLLVLVAIGVGGVLIKHGDATLLPDNSIAKTTKNKTWRDDNPSLQVPDGYGITLKSNGASNSKNQSNQTDATKDLENKAIIVSVNGSDDTLEVYLTDPNYRFPYRHLGPNSHYRLVRDVPSNYFPYQNAIFPNREIRNRPEFRSFHGGVQYPQPYQFRRPSYPGYARPSYGYGANGQGYGYNPTVQTFAPEGFQPITKSENKVYSKQSKGGYSFYQPPAPKMKFNQWTGPTYSVNNQDTKSSIGYNMLGKLFGKGSAGIKGAFSDWGVNKYGNQDRFTASGGSKSQLSKDRYNAASGPGVQGYNGGGSGGFMGQSNVNSAPGGYGSGGAQSSAYGQSYGGVNRPYEAPSYSNRGFPSRGYTA